MSRKSNRLKSRVAMLDRQLKCWQKFHRDLLGELDAAKRERDKVAALTIKFEKPSNPYGYHNERMALRIEFDPREFEYQMLRGGGCVAISPYCDDIGRNVGRKVAKALEDFINKEFPLGVGS